MAPMSILHFLWVLASSSSTWKLPCSSIFSKGSILVFGFRWKQCHSYSFLQVDLRLGSSLFWEWLKTLWHVFEALFSIREVLMVNFLNDCGFLLFVMTKPIWPWCLAFMNSSTKTNYVNLLLLLRGSALAMETSAFRLHALFNMFANIEWPLTLLWMCCFVYVKHTQCSSLNQQD